MSVSIEKGEGDVRVLKLTGVLTKKEFDDLRSEAGKRLGFFDRVRLLILTDKFDGWEPGADWGDNTFFTWHGWKITKIAIVADEQWKSKFLAFTVAGMRRAPVEFSSPDRWKRRALGWKQRNRSKAHE